MDDAKFRAEYTAARIQRLTTLMLIRGKQGENTPANILGEIRNIEVELDDLAKQYGPIRSPELHTEGSKPKKQEIEELRAEFNDLRNKHFQELDKNRGVENAGESSAMPGDVRPEDNDRTMRSSVPQPAHPGDSSPTPGLESSGKIDRDKPVKNPLFTQPPEVPNLPRAGRATRALQPLVSHSSKPFPESQPQKEVSTESPTRMFAYLVLDGGGVKAPALAGALQAAADAGIEWIAFGGTSAGALIAVLGAAGYLPEEIHNIVTQELPFTQLLDDQTGERLQEFEGLWREVSAIAAGGGICPPLLKARRLANNAKQLYNKLNQSLGIYSGDEVREFLFAKIVAKIPALATQRDISFADLARHGCKPLKVVASDLTTSQAIVFPDESGMNYSVLDAARASMSYPIVFQPVQYGSRRLVDGGLCANLPVFLFETERCANRAAVIAIDLIGNDTGPQPMAGYDLFHLVQDMVSTAIDGSDTLMRNQIQGLHRVPVPLSPPVNTLDFSISADRRETMFQNGYVAFAKYANKCLKIPLSAQSQIEQLQARFRLSPRTLDPVLRSVGAGIEQVSGAREIRSHIMLPTMRGTRIVTYQFGMDLDSDSDLELEIGAGFSGIAYTSASPALGDLVEAGKNPKVLGLTLEQQAKIPRNRTAMLSVPIFAAASQEKKQDEPYVIGTLSVDTTTAFWDTLWLENLPDGSTAANPKVLGFLADWADVLSRLLL
ncbi:MAG: patatin-like phospholipase family protein [Tepidisphaeraceae bacterium]